MALRPSVPHKAINNIIMNMKLRECLKGSTYVTECSPNKHMHLLSRFKETQIKNFLILNIVFKILF